MASPNIFTPYTSTLKKRPGHNAIQGAWNIYVRASPLSIPPQLGFGGGIPKPRKLKPASARIVPGIDIVKIIMIGARILGKTCFLSIDHVELPIATAELR
jgi:hypothetical protein